MRHPNNFTRDYIYVCGVHSRNLERTELIKNPNKQKEILNELNSHKETVEMNSQNNKNNNKKGTIQCYKMQMMKSVPLISGKLNVFPNNKHQNRSDGFGCCSLSPMRLGPVTTHEYYYNDMNELVEYPKVKLLESYHQQSKLMPNEVDEEGNPTKEFREMRLQGYNDPIPRRHKYDTKTMNKLRKEINGENRNQPLYSVHYTVTGEEKRYTYVQSRYFYCCVYEELAKKTEDFKKLIEFINNGTDIIICGYDAYPVTKSLYEHYCDPSKAFGHELVLYTLLTVSDVYDYPWREYRRNHEEIYEGIIL